MANDILKNKNQIEINKNNISDLRTDVNSNTNRLIEVENQNAQQQENIDFLNEALESTFEFDFDLTPSILVEGAFTRITAIPDFTIIDPTIIKVAINAKITNTNAIKKYTLRITNGGTIEGVDYFNWDVEQLQDTQNIGGIWQPPQIPAGTYHFEYFVEAGSGTATLNSGNIRVDNKGNGTSVDLSGYITQTQLNNALLGYVEKDFVGTTYNSHIGYDTSGEILLSTDNGNLLFKSHNDRKTFSIKRLDGDYTPTDPSDIIVKRITDAIDVRLTEVEGDWFVFANSVLPAIDESIRENADDIEELISVSNDLTFEEDIVSSISGNSVILMSSYINFKRISIRFESNGVIYNGGFDAIGPRVGDKVSIGPATYNIVSLTEIRSDTSTHTILNVYGIGRR